MLIIDAHLDLAYNALNYGRSLTKPAAEIRKTEAPDNYRGTISATFPEMQKGGVGLVFGTLFVVPAHANLAVMGNKVTYHNAEQAHSLAMKQLDYYHRLTDEVDELKLVTDSSSLEAIVQSHNNGDEPSPVGIVPLMEGTDPIRAPEEAKDWYERGLRLIGPAWDDTRYTTGAWSNSQEGLTQDGYHLLEIMADLGFILDLTHMSEKATIESLERYEGIIVATHTNCRKLIPGQRQFSDTQIRLLGERDGVMGTVLYNSFLRKGWKNSRKKSDVTLNHVVANIDHVCQILGNAQHVGIGSDLDGGFGAEAIPAELDTIADLPKIAAKLQERGYKPEDIVKIMGGNWLRILRQAFS
ncbi:MAG: peptidase M19 [Chloroflexi bacterium]|nr:MAG: peptidase M19 [Chloroflexota bacterium]